MKKLDDVMHQIDVRVAQKLAPFWAFFQKYFVIFSVSLLTLLTAVFFFKVFYSRSQVFTSVVKEDLATIEKILTQIDKECNILTIRPGRAAIDFLTVEKFTGSTVGCLNLAYPKKWAGPFLQQNPSLQGKPYDIVRVMEGFYVLPGAGVKLPNGLVMGKDVVIRPDSRVSAMLQSGGQLNYKDQALGFRIKFKIGDWDTPRLQKGTIDKINEFLKEFNEALPYAQYQCPEAPVRA